MTDTADKTTEKPKRARRRKVRMEDDARVVAWCDAFITRTKEEHGFTPTQDQAIQACLNAFFEREPEEF